MNSTLIISLKTIPGNTALASRFSSGVLGGVPLKMSPAGSPRRLRHTNVLLVTKLILCRDLCGGRPVIARSPFIAMQTFGIIGLSDAGLMMPNMGVLAS